MTEEKFTQNWPALPWKEWEATATTLHMWTQIVGKTRLAIQVAAQLAGEFTTPGAGTTAGTGVWTGAAAAKTRATDNSNTGRDNAIRDMPILGLDCVQCPWSDKIRNQTVPNKAKLSMTAADPMSLAMPARG